MTNETYTAAIEAIAEIKDEIDRLDNNHEYLLSVHDTIHAESVEMAICDKLSEVKGMKKMLSLIAGVDYDKVSSDVLEYRNN